MTHSQFLDLADQLIVNVQFHQDKIIEALKTMSLMAVVMSKSQTWPFVTFADFDLWINRASIGATLVSMIVLT